MLTSHEKLSTKATTKAAPATTLPRYPRNIPTDFEPPVPIQIGESERGFTVQRRRVRSSFEFVTNDISLAPLGLRADTMGRGRPHAGHYVQLDALRLRVVLSLVGTAYSLRARPLSSVEAGHKSTRPACSGPGDEHRESLWSVLLWVSIQRGHGYVLSSDDALNVPRKAKSFRITSAVACGFLNRVISICDQFQ